MIERNDGDYAIASSSEWQQISKATRFLIEAQRYGNPELAEVGKEILEGLRPVQLPTPLF